MADVKINVITKALGIKSLVDVKAAFDIVGQAVKGVTNVVKGLTDAYAVQQAADTQLASVLKSTGGAAGITYDEVKNLADQMQELTGVSNEVVQGAQNVLLTFTNIGKDVFPSATETVLNMSQALGQDLKSSSIQLGKALQDPIMGVTALRRVGVNFSAAQQDVIKNLVETGKTAEAQKLILKELETEFGDSAAAARQTLGGSLKALSAIQGDLQEELGSQLAPAVYGISESMIEAAMSSIEWFNKNKILEKSINFIIQILTNPIFIGIASSILAIVGAITAWTTIQMTLNGLMILFNSILAINPMIIIIASITLLIGALAGLIVSTDKGRKLFVDSVNKIAKGGVIAFNIILEMAKALLKSLENTFSGIFKLFLNLGKSIVAIFKGDFKSAGKYAKEGLDAIAKIGENFKSNFSDVFKIASENSEKAFSAIDKGTGKLNKKIIEFRDSLEKLREKFKNPIKMNAEFRSSISETLNLDANTSGLEESLNNFAKNIKDIFSSIYSEMSNLGKEIFGAETENLKKRLEDLKTEKKDLDDIVSSGNELNKIQQDRLDSINAEIDSLEKAAQGGEKAGKVLDIVQNAMSNFSKGGIAGIISGIIGLIAGLIDLLKDELAPAFDLLIPFFIKLVEKTAVLANEIMPLLISILEFFIQMLSDTNDAIIAVVKIIVALLTPLMSVLDLVRSLMAVLSPLISILEILVPIIELLNLSLLPMTVIIQLITALLSELNPYISELKDNIKGFAGEIRKFTKDINKFFDNLIKNIGNLLGSSGGGKKNKNSNPFAGWFANGGDFMVNKPTLIGVGERGAERVTITPQGQSNNSNYSQVINIGSINNSGDVDTISKKLALEFANYKRNL